jgi:hypothetical protein
MLGENVKSLGKGAWQAIRLLGASLRIQLLAWIFLTLIGAICINLYLSFVTANATANLILDQTLMASARVIAEDVTVDESGAAQIDIPPAALEMFDTGYQDRVFYRVITAWGNLVAGFPDLTESTRPGIGEEAVFHDSPVRLLTLYHPLVGLKQQGDIAVTVATTRNGWTAMRDRLWLSDFSKQLSSCYLLELSRLSGCSAAWRRFCACATRFATGGASDLIRCRSTSCRRNCAPWSLRSTTIWSACKTRSRLRGGLSQTQHTNCVHPSRSLRCRQAWRCARQTRRGATRPCSPSEPARAL